MLLLLIELVLVLLFFVAFAIRTSWFQTYLGQEATSYLSDGLDRTLKIEKVDIIFFDRVALEGIFVEDKFGDTLLFAQALEVNIDDYQLDSLIFDVSEVSLIDVHANLRKAKGDSTFNFQHLVDYFATNSDDTSSTPFQVNVEALVLDNVNFKFDDENADRLTYGLDYAHLDLKALKGEIRHTVLTGTEVSTELTHLSFQDQSGLVVNDLTAKVLYSPNLIRLDTLNINLAESTIQADHLALSMANGAADFSDFLNQVRFDGHLKGTTVALTDLALFVPSLEGMTDDVIIKNAVLTGPVNGMRINETDIRLLSNTILKGNFQIPNLDDIDGAFINERIDLFRTSVRDIEQLNLSPFLAEGRIDLPSNLDGLATIELKDGHFTGVLSDFVVDGDITTGLGNLYSENGLKFKKQADGIYHYQGKINTPEAQDIIVENLDLALLTNNSNLGTVNGYLQVLPGSKGFSADDIDLLFAGDFNSIQLNGYDYHNIAIKSGRYHEERFDGVIDIKDDNLALNYDGYVDFKDELLFNFDLKIDSSYLAKMNLIEGDLATKLNTKINVNLSGDNLDNIKGEVKISKLSYYDGKHELDLSDLELKVERSELVDKVLINSEYLDGELIGQFDFAYIYPVLKNQLARIIPNLIPLETIPEDVVEDYVVRLNLKDINPILAFFDEALFVEPNTQIELTSKASTKYAEAHLISNKISYGDKVLKGIDLRHRIDSVQGDLIYELSEIRLNDSITVDHFKFNSNAKQNRLITELEWATNGVENPALFAFETSVRKNHDIVTVFSSSFFHLQDSKWSIEPKSSVLWNVDHIEVSHLNILNKNHQISLDGKVSENPNDWLSIIVKDFDLSELNGFLGGQMTLDGNLNLDGKISDLYNDLKFISKSHIDTLKINSELVGDISLNGKWDKIKNAVEFDGDLIRDQIKTFDFDGFYYVDRTKDNIAMKLNFDHTNIAFLNAFKDPELYTDIRGNIDGKLDIRGELDNPIIAGHLNVENTKVSVPMFNVDYEINGLLNFEEGEILADYLELRDELGNLGVGMMQIYHEQYTNWNYDITLDLGDPNITKTFLAMNTFYKEGDVYYGKAFVTGDVNIFGYNGLTEISVNVKTEKGTNLTLPLYGTSETEENSFVKFYNPDTTDKTEEIVKIERLGMTLSMNFEVTDEAQVNIVFDPVLNDQIVAKGFGDIEMTMDDYGDIEMFGKYTINEGYYNFNMKNLVTEQFEIIEGSTLAWTQSPYDANIDIKTRFERHVDMSDIMSSEINSTKQKDLVYGYLNLSNTLLTPSLTLDIEAPQARDEAKNALNQIRAIEDDLNKQFFSLLLLKKFIPVAGSLASGSGKNVTEDLINQQINAVLGQVGENYNLNSNIGTDHAELGFSTSFLDDKLKITSSVGYLSTGEDGDKASNIVGDVNIEYELNEDGTFTVNVFNTSNENAASQDQGPFTQGLGLSYQESFNSGKDFKLLQGFLNLFRKKEKKKKEKGDLNGRKTEVEEVFTPTVYQIEN